MMRNKHLKSACEELRLALHGVLDLCPSPSSFITTGDAQRMCTHVDSSVLMTLSWHSFPFPVCFSALQQMEQMPNVNSYAAIRDCLEKRELNKRLFNSVIVFEH